VTAKDVTKVLEFYKVLLTHLASSTPPGASTRVQAIFPNATSTFRRPRQLAAAVQSVDALVKDPAVGTGDVPK
jgi:hypothetical protein